MSESRREQRELRILGEAFRELREQHSLTVGELAAATGIARTRISALEAGRLDPHFELLLTLARGMGISLAALILRTEELEAQEEQEEQEERGE